MRAEKTILKKVDEWKELPMMVSGIYRLFTYLPFEKIPEEYKSFFPEDAEKDWNKDLKEYGKKEIETDIDAEARSILQVLAKRNITSSLGLIPMLLADVYMYGQGINGFQGKLAKMIKKYEDNIDLDRSLAEQLAIHEIVDLLKEITTKINVKLNFNLDIALEQIIEQYNKATEATMQAMVSQSKQYQTTSKKDDLDLEKLVEEAEAKEKEALKKKVDEDTEDGK